MRRLWLTICILLIAIVIAGWSMGLRPAERDASLSTLHENNRRALLALFDRTGRYGWRNFENWPLGSLSTLYGVTVVDGRVTRLELPENNLSISGGFVNSLPPEIGDLTHLEVLDLRGNVLRGAVPEEILKLTRLRELYLQSNLLSDLPDLSPLREHALVEVHVADNMLTFEDLEPNVDQGFVISYILQRKVSLNIRSLR